jgi:hypothetical protein
VTQKTENPRETQDMGKKGSGPETEEGYEIISNPDNPHFDPYWYEKCNIPDDDPWHYIVHDFIDGDFTIKRLLRDKVKIKKLITFKQASSKRAIDQVEIAVNEAHFLLKNIEKKIRFKELDAEFVWYWGEFQKNVGIASSKYSQLLANRKKGEFDRGVNDKQVWYASFLKLLKEEKYPRKKANKEIAKLVDGLVKGTVDLPKGFSKEWFSELLHKESNKHTDPMLRLTYRRELNIDETLQKFPEYKDKIPPIGFSNYPKFQSVN